MPPPPDLLRSWRWWQRTLLINAALVLIVAVAIQALPVPRTNPPTHAEPVWDAPLTRELAVRACFDCHSHQTRWPWYSAIAPLRWVIWYDVTEGREALNFSAWEQHLRADYVDPDDPFPPPPLSARIAEEIRSGRMPPGSYRLLHPEARLSAAEQAALIAGLQATVQQNQNWD